MTTLTENNINILIGSSLGGFFLSLISYILRKYIKKSKCHNNILGSFEMSNEAHQATTSNQSIYNKPQETV